MAACSKQGASWDDVVRQEAAWQDGSPSVRAGIASLAATCLCTRLQCGQRPTGGAAPSMSKQPSLRPSDDVLDLQNMTEHAAAKLQQQLSHETNADVLTSLLKLVQAVADSIMHMLSHCKQPSGAQPNGTHAKKTQAQQAGQASVVRVSAVACCAEQLFAAAEAAVTLQQHSALLAQLTRSVCQVAAAARSQAGAQLPGSFHVKATTALQKLLARVLELLIRPPQEVFSNIGGTPEAPSEERQGAAERWQHDSTLLLAAATELLDMLARLGALQLAHSKQRGAEAGTAAGESEAASSFWDDLKLASGSSLPAESSPAQAAERQSQGVEKVSEQMRGATVSKERPGAQQPGSKGGPRKPLIEEIRGPSSGVSSAGVDRAASRQQAAILSRCGVIIEEIADDISEAAADVSDDVEIPTLTASEAADVLLACALHSTDPRLDAPWASAATAAAAASALECLARHLPTTRLRQRDTRGMNGHAARQGMLASPVVQAAIVELLPAAVPRLSSVLIQTPEQQRQKARLEPYTGPGVFERAVAAQQLAWCVSRVGYRALGTVVGFALPVILAAVDDASPAVQRQGLWALHHLATEALPADLLWQKEALLKAARKALVGCDESVWPAASAAACALAVSLEGRDIFGTGYEWVLGEMLTQGNSYAHVPARRIIWLQSAQPLLQAMGLASVRYFSRLLPLLLEWVHAPDVDTCLAALPVLHTVITRTWPRMPAHAGIIWLHVAQEFAREFAIAQKSGARERKGVLPEETAGGERSASGQSSKKGVCGTLEGQDQGRNKRQELMDWQQRIAEVLWWAGGEPFREGVKAKKSEDPWVPELCF